MDIQKVLELLTESRKGKYDLLSDDNEKKEKILEGFNSSRSQRGLCEYIGMSSNIKNSLPRLEREIIRLGIQKEYQSFLNKINALKTGTKKCPCCDYMATSDGDLSRHKEQVHPEYFVKRKKNNYVCLYCGQPLGTNKRKGWEQHRENCKEWNELYKLSSGGHRHTDDTKRKLGEITKQWLLDNPDKHPWKSAKKLVSGPCEYLKEKLRKLGYAFTAEEQPIKGRYYSIDIAFPEKKIGIEVNGYFHYDDITAETLAEYYRDRDNVFKQNGWNEYQLRWDKIDKNFNNLISWLKENGIEPIKKNLI